LRKALLLTLGGLFVAVTAIFAGPVSSGGLFLLRPVASPAAPEGVPEDYEPLHAGGIDLATGLYVRENEDLVVPGAPELILRRTYLSRDRVSRRFGVGTTHSGEEYLYGDGEHFQWVSLILARGTRINFRRVSAGTWFLNALYEHDESGTEWQAGQLGWTGVHWALRKADGSLSIYRPCGPTSVCSILRSRDSAGQTTHYRRNASGTLVRMDDGGERWIEFEYDEHHRIVLAKASTNREVRYSYDSRGRLVRVIHSDGDVSRYTYTELDELATIEEPGTSIENLYANGRCVRQVNRYPDADPYVYEITYQLDGERILRTDTNASDGVWTQYSWGDGRHAVREALGRKGAEPAVFTYERDPKTKAVTALSVTCPDRRGQPLRHSSVVRAGQEERVKRNLIETHCNWNTWRR
jgi:YD repeat-containing protein